MGRKERARYKHNDQVVALLEKPEWTLEEREYVQRHYTGYGALNGHGSSLGQFYTPNVVAEFVVQLLNIKEGATVCEPSCGIGTFLSVLPTNTTVMAAELSREAATIASRLYTEATIYNGDGLEFLSMHRNAFDNIVGNPPYGGMILAPQSRFANKKGEVAPDLAFMEASLEALKPGGKLAMVVPDGLLSSGKYQNFRKWAIENYDLWASISLPVETFHFAGTGCKTSILVFQKPITQKQSPDSMVFMAIVKDLGWDSRGRDTGKNDLPALLGEWRRFVQEHRGSAAESEDHFIMSFDVNDSGQMTFNFAAA